MRSEILRSPFRILPWIVTLWGMILVGIHLYGAFFPNSLNWGFHQFGYYPKILKIILPILMILTLIPVVQKRLLEYIERLISRFKGLPQRGRTQLSVGLLLLSILVLWVGRQCFFLLGDGTLMPRTLPFIRKLSEAVAYFHYEPLAGILNWEITRLFAAWGFAGSPELPIQLLNILFGAGCIALMALLARRLADDAIDRILLFGLFVAAGSSALFFGYVENYTSLCLGFLLYIWLSVGYFKGRVHPSAASVAFGGICTLHFGMLCMIPSFLLLIFHDVRRKLWQRGILSLLIAVTTWIGLLLLLGYSLDQIWNTLTMSRKHALGMGEVRNEFQGYTLFSIMHLNDILNIQILIAPFALIMLFSVVILGPKNISSRNFIWLFLILTALSGLAFSLFFNFDFGMSRDWDLLAPFTLGLLVASGYAWVRFVDQSVRRLSFIPIIILTCIPTIAYTVINASEKRGMMRFQTLADQQFWGRKTLMASYEEIAVFFRDRQKYQEAKTYYRNFLELDSTNARIWGKLSEVYRTVGDESNEADCYRHAISYGSRSWMVYVNLGMIYAKQGRFADAIETTKKSLDLHPTSAVPFHALGEYHTAYNNGYRDALQFYLRAIEVDPLHADSYLKAGYCYLKMNNPEDAKPLMEKYAAMRPDDPRVQRIEEFLRAYRSSITDSVSGNVRQ